MLEFGATGARALAQILEAFKAGLTELLRLRVALRQSKNPLSWADFVDSIKKLNVPWQDSIRGLDVEVFQLGKLIAKAPDGFEWSKWLIFKDQLKDSLEKEFGVRFKLKIKRPEDS